MGFVLQNRPHSLKQKIIFISFFVFLFTAYSNLLSDEPLTEKEKVIHTLNRLAFGPTQGQVNRVLEQGWKSWVNEQLQPKKIDDQKLEKQIHKHYPSLYMEMNELIPSWSSKAKRKKLRKKINKEERKALRKLERKRRHSIQKELSSSVLTRAINSKRQLKEVMVNFWRNHFNIDQNKEHVAYLAPHFEEQVIRKHVFGKFQDMLMASAKHPAMLIYLDNYLSRKPKSKNELLLIKAQAVGKMELLPKRIRNKKNRDISGLNENYARELMELHTLGVDNYYKQLDVIDVARAFTGWTINQKEGKKYGFKFMNQYHDKRGKKILGKRIKSRITKAGVYEGEAILRGLTKHKGTAQYISQKLCTYLVNDSPSSKLVRDIAKVFRKSDGDLKKVTQAIIMHPEFFSRENYQVKFKTPFEFVVSSIRAANAEVSDDRNIMQRLKLMGQPIYQCEDPTGYYDEAEAWLDPGVLVHRWDFALNIAQGKVYGINLSHYKPWIKATPFKEIKASLTHHFTPQGLSPKNKKDIEHLFSDNHSKIAKSKKLFSYLVGSPTFQLQ